LLRCERGGISAAIIKSRSCWEVGASEAVEGGWREEDGGAGVGDLGLGSALGLGRCSGVGAGGFRDATMDEDVSVFPAVGDWCRGEFARELCLGLREDGCFSLSLSSAAKYARDCW
jgi:hypothetical protein